MITREQIDRLKQLAEDLEFYRTLPVPSPELERALGHELQFLGQRSRTTRVRTSYFRYCNLQRLLYT